MSETAESMIAELVEAIEPVMAISDRDHEAWRKARAAIARAKSLWHDISTAPLDGTPVRAGRISVMSIAGQPLYPLVSRFIDGKWQCCFGDDRWAPYDPQPTVWQPLPHPLTPKDTETPT